MCNSYPLGVPKQVIKVCNRICLGSLLLKEHFLSFLFLQFTAANLNPTIFSLCSWDKIIFLNTSLTTVVSFVRRWNFKKCNNLVFLRSILDRNSIFKPFSAILLSRNQSCFSQFYHKSRWNWWKIQIFKTWNLNSFIARLQVILKDCYFIYL